MTHYSHIPLVRLIIPFLLGIIIFLTYEYFLSEVVLLVLFSFLLIIGLLINRYLMPQFQYSFAYGVNVMIFMFLAGYVLGQVRYELHKPQHFSHYNWEDSMLRIRLLEPVAEKTNSWQVVGRVTHVVHTDSIALVRGKIIIWLEKDTLAEALRYGDVILLENFFQPTRPPQNPNAFDYRKFLARQNIYHQTYRRSGQWYPAGVNEGLPLISGAHQMRQKALETLEANNISGRDFAVAAALLLGYREYLDEDLQREFAGAGAMHILCVSGLHVGIIFMALNLIFGFLTKIPRGRYVKTVVIILLIWFYAAITGFAPSVQRASTMFSFVAIGQTFRRNTNIYNTLAASAMFLALADPYIVSRIGFQLSYIAVISIVTLQPLFHKQLYFKNKIMDNAWGIVTVSLAAQLGTGPIALYYFNQFPNYFLLTNLIVIPLTGIIIKTGIFLFMTAPFVWLSQYVGIVLSWVLLVLHNSVRIIEGLPGSVANNISIGFHDKILIFIAIALIGVLWAKKEKKMVIPVLIVFGLLSLSFSARSVIQHQQQQMVVYQVPGGTAIDFISGKNCYFLACENTLSNPSAISFHIRDHRLRSGLGSREPFLIGPGDTLSKDLYLKQSGFLNVEGNIIKIIDRNTIIPSLKVPGPDPLHIIIRDNARIDLQSLANIYDNPMLIFDNSNSLRNQRRWQNLCDSLGLGCWSVGLNGAYVTNF